MRRQIYSETFNSYLGAGLTAGGLAGALDSDFWAITGFSSEADLSRGVTSGGVTTGGLYALSQDDGNNALYIQPGGSDFTPGTLLLTVEAGSLPLTEVAFSFDRIVNNNTDRGNSFDLELSVDGGATFTPLDSFTSDTGADALGVVTQSVTVDLPDLTADTTLQFRWTGNDENGSGSRDEFGIDNVVLSAAETGDMPVSSELFVESFEDDPGTSYTLTTAFDDGGFDFFGRFSVPDTGNGARDDFLQGFDGNFAIFAQDNDGDGGPATTAISIPDIALGGFEAPTLTVSLGALDSEQFQNYEGDDGIRILATLDDGDAVEIGRFAPVAGGGNLALDTDGDGIGDGAVLTTTLQDFTFDLPDGAVLDLQIELTSDASFEPLVVDNVRVGDNSDVTPEPEPGDGTIDDDPTLISDIQGTQDTALLVGQTVVVEGIVSGDFQNGDADDFRSIGGFFLMEETEDQDENALTSEGIFAFEGDGDTALDVNAGDKVRVLGTVVERFGKTTIEVTDVRVEEAEAVDPLSLAVGITLPDLDGREAIESMLVTVTEALTFTESFDYEDFGTATLSTDGPVYQFTQLNAPDVAGNSAYQAETQNRLITIDNGTDGRRGDFDPITAPDGALLGGDNTIRMGQSTTDLTAIVDFTFGEFSLRLPGGVDFDLDEDTNPEPLAPLDVGSDYKVATLNVLNFFTTVEGTTDIGAQPRGADNPEELARQTDKLVTAIVGLDSDVVGLIELENDFAGDSFAIMTLVDAINVRVGEVRWDYVDPGIEFVGDDAIAVGFIYDTFTTNLVGDAAILDTPEFLNPLGAGSPDASFNRAALAQTFEDKDSGGIFTASVNHFKSKGSLTGAEADEDQGDGAGNNNATRTEAARVLSEWLETDPTNSGDDDVLILGDLNSYARETPITTLEDAGYTDLARNFEGDEAYSFRFSTQIGTLDYGLANESLLNQVTGADTWHINSDTPVIFDYNLDDTFTFPNILRPTDQELFDGLNPGRASDHDPLVIGLDLENDAPPLIISGTDGNDRLAGTGGNDILISGGGRLDVMTGGGGADIFVFTDTEDRRDGLRILDFDTEIDFLDLDGASVASARSLGNSLRLTLSEDRDSIILRNVSDFESVMIINDGFEFT